MTFIRPVNVGELLTCSASVNAAWRTSMEVGVRVEAENPRTGERRHTSTAYLTMVAVDDDADPSAAADGRVGAPERRRQREAELRRRNRLAERRANPGRSPLIKSGSRRQPSRITSGP